MSLEVSKGSSTIFMKYVNLRTWYSLKL